MTADGSLKIFEVNKRGVFIQGLEGIAVGDLTHALALLIKGSKRRQIAAIKFNVHSSRSNSVFTITVHHRAGGVPALVMRDRENGLNFGVVSSSTPAAAERNKTHLSASSSTASLRGLQPSTTSTNPWRDSSVDPPSLHVQPQHQQSASDSSPASSRRSSILTPTNNTSSPLYQSHFNSRPPSSYSSSSESIGKRNSLMPFMGSPATGMMSPMAMQMNMMSKRKVSR